MTTAQELTACKEQRKLLSEKTDGLSARARKRHRGEIDRLKKSLSIAIEAVDEQEFYKHQNTDLYLQIKKLKEERRELKKRNKFYIKELKTLTEG